MASIGDLSGHTCQFTDPITVEIPNGLNVRTFTTDRRKKVQMAVSVYGRPEKILAATYYRYYDGSEPSGLPEHAEKIMGGFEVS